MDLYVCLMQIAYGSIHAADRRMAFTLSSGTAKTWAEDNSGLGATYHVITIGSALPLD